MTRHTPVLIALAVLAVGCAKTAPTAPSPSARIAELEDLRAGGSAELAEFTRHQDPEVRVLAVRAVARIQDPADLPTLIAAQSDADSRVAQLAVWGIGQLGFAVGNQIPPEAVDSVSTWLSSDDPSRVATAAEALGKLATNDAEAAILSLAGAPQAEVREAVAHALFRLRFAPRWRREVDAEPPASVAAAITLHALLADPEPGPRRAAAHAYSRLAAPEAAAALVPLLSDADEWTRFFAVRALGRIGADAPAEAIAPLLVDSSPLVRREAVAALIAAGAGAQIPLATADDSAAPVRAAVAGALGARNDDASFERLARLEAEDPSSTVRQAALAALARRGGSVAVERLESRLGDSQPAVRAAAVVALAGVAPELQERLGTPALADANRVVRLRGLETFGQAPFAASAVSAALAADDIAERGTAVDIIAASEAPDRNTRLREAFAASTGDEWIELRESLVEALGSDAEFLASALQDPAPSVRARAHAALARIGQAPDTAGEPAPRTPSPFLGTTLPHQPRVAFETVRGRFVIEGLDEDAPLHVASLLALVDRGFYDGLTIHRVVPGFVVQGGDPRGDGWGGPEFQLRDEISRTPLDRGMVGMAKAGKDTGGSQFFVTLAPTPHLDGNYTVYGRIVEGMDVIDQLEVGDQIVRAVRLTPN